MDPELKIKGMIFAAGLGTRLKPFTDQHPKALFEVQGKTLLQHSLEHFREAGIIEAIINVHHFAGQITEFLRVHHNFGMEIAISDESGMLLETGGGLKKASWFFSDCNALVARNVDILSDLDLKDMIRHHRQHQALVTLAVRNRETARYFLFDDEMRLKGWMNKSTGETRPAVLSEGLLPKAFSGIQVLDPEVFPLITEVGKFSLTELYLRLAAEHKIIGYIDKSSYWKDAGKP